LIAINYHNHRICYRENKKGLHCANLVKFPCKILQRQFYILKRNCGNTFDERFYIWRLQMKKKGALVKGIKFEKGHKFKLV